MKTLLRCVERSETRTVYKVIDSVTGQIIRTIVIETKGCGFN